MAITFARAQTSVYNSASSPCQVTFGSTPTEGNLLVVVAAERSGGDADDWTISGSGWTKRIAHNKEITDSTWRFAMAVWTKVAGASEPSSISVSDTSGTVNVYAQEFEAGESVTWTHEDSTSSDNGQVTGDTDGHSVTSGSVGAGDLLALGCGEVKENDYGSTQVWVWSGDVENS